MSGPDAFSQTLGTLLLALAFSAFILFVHGYRPAGVGAFWYDLVLGFVGLWLALWPEVATFLRETNAASALGLLLQVVATLLGGLLGAGVAKALQLTLQERRAGRPARTGEHRKR
ncbi:hypothetical protein DK254_23685 [Pseudomonas sp. RW407]|uniref:hypothetical protein n=1 Tax=Pseudomonas sp. RW407 TaxID=2202894 RepID=UPI000D7003FE|nr:hypothetical protein [Pseudomonas sp. RW407]PWU28938.1 hypothetical protein DK254_23685 [Pseudomonas sp. RW407]